MLQIWESFRRLPNWVQAWMSFWLVPVNVASLFFVGQGEGVLVAVLAIAGMALNLPIMIATKGMSGAMAFPHLVLWVPLVAICGWLLISGRATGGFAAYLVVVGVTDVVSLIWDGRDAADWVKGDRAVA